jgi:hypothetical protein
MKDLLTQFFCLFFLCGRKLSYINKKLMVIDGMDFCLSP